MGFFGELDEQRSILRTNLTDLCKFSHDLVLIADRANGCGERERERSVSTKNNLSENGVEWFTLSSQISARRNNEWRSHERNREREEIRKGKKETRKERRGWVSRVK